MNAENLTFPRLILADGTRTIEAQGHKANKERWASQLALQRHVRRILL